MSCYALHPYSEWIFYAYLDGASRTDESKNKQMTEIAGNIIYFLQNDNFIRRDYKFLIICI